MEGKECNRLEKHFAISSTQRHHEYLNLLRNHPSFLKLTSSWNLAVYFQIRFQEIAMPFELSLGIGSVFVLKSSEAGLSLF